MGIQNWSTTPANNATAAPNINMQTGSAPSTVHPSIRQMMADVATWYADPEWLTQADTPTYVNTTSFSVPGDRTGTYLVGRRVKAIGTGYAITGSISASTYTSLTTVTVAWDSGSLDSTVSQVAVGLQSASSLPLTGGTLTGQTSISGAAGTDRAFGWQTVGVARWFGGADSAAEPNDGSNSGSNWFLSRFSDAGAFIDTPLTVSRSTGQLALPNGFSNRPTFAGATPWDSANFNPSNYLPLAGGGTLTSGIIGLAKTQAWTTAGWFKSVQAPNLGCSEYSGVNYHFGIGNSPGDLLSIFTTTAQDASAAANYLLQINASTGVAAFAQRPTFNGATPWDSINLNYTPAHADDSWSWTSVWTGNATSINLYSNWGIGVYLIQIGSGGGQVTMITTGAGGSGPPASVATGDIYSGSAAIQIWKLTKG